VFCSLTVMISWIWLPALSEIVLTSKSVIVWDIVFSKSCCEIWVWIVNVVPPVRETSLLIMSPVWM